MTATKKFLLFSIMLFAYQCVWAIAFFQPSKTELAMLPPYCEPLASGWNNATLKKQPHIKKWLQVFGEKNFEHMHHYCHALLRYNELFLLYNPKIHQSKEILAYKIVSECDYVERGVSKDFRLMHELVWLRAKALFVLEKYTKAEIELQRSLKIKPNYVKAYITLAEVYAAQNEIEKAIQMTRKALQYKPKSKLLKRRLKRYQSINNQ